MFRNRLSVRRVCAAAAVVSAVSFGVVAPTAEATASGCTAWKDSAVSAKAKCTVGPGFYYVWARCYRAATGHVYIDNGNTVTVPSTSITICATGHVVTSWGVTRL